jgi:hypothetical protein
VAETDAGQFSTSDGAMTFKIKKSGTSFLLEMVLAISNRSGVTALPHTMDPRISLAEGQWTLVGRSEQSSNSVARHFFHIFARVSKTQVRD